MMSIEEALAQAEIISDDENWVRIEKYPYKSFYEDEEETFIDLEKREISDPSKNVSTLGENNSQLITFVMDRYADGVDLVDMLIQIQYKLQSGEESTVGPVNVYASNDKIKFGWAISNIQTQVVQTIQFIVYCTGKLADGESYLLKTKPMSYRIENTLGTGGYVEKPDEDWFLQFENVMNEKMNQVASLASIAIDSAAVAKESKERVAEDRSVVEELAPQVKADAESAKTSEKNAEEWYNKTVERSGVNYASEELAGVVSPQGIYVNPENGKMHMTMETTETAMPNSHKGRLMVEEIGGVMEQDSTTGKNIFNIKTLTPRSDTQGGTVNFVGDVANVSSANQSWATLFSDDISVEIGKSYILKIKVSNYSATTEVILAISNSEGVRYSQKYITANGYYEIVFVATTNAAKVQVVANNNSNQVTNTFTISEAQLEEGTVATAYEPYTNGPSPNPSYPQEISNVAISGIRTHGKNLAYSSRASDLVTQGITFHIVRDSLGRILYIEVSGTATADAVFNLSKKQLTVGKEYVISGCPSGGSKDTYCMNWAYAGDEVGEGFSHVYNGTEGQLRIRIKNGITVNNLRFYPMLREEGTDATYEPYTESVVTFSQPIELYGLDDVRDILTNKQIKRKYAKVVFDGSDDEAWNGSSTIGRYYMNNLRCKGYTPILCSQAKNDRTETLNTCYVHAASNGRFIIYTEFATMAEWKAHLASNPMTVVYEMAEETTEELPIADQIALNSLQTFNGITHVEFISDVKPTFKGEYGTSKIGGYTLEALLTARSADLKATAAQSTNEEV